MNGKLAVFVPLLAFSVFYFYRQAGNSQQKLDFTSLLKDGYFGSGSPKEDDPKIYPFQVTVSDAQLKELKERLKNTKITHEQLEDVPDFSYGFNLKTLLEFKDYWVNKYDWRKEEKLINSFPHFVTQIEGLKIHFIHVKPPAKTYKTVVQLLLSHGWPGSVHEFSKILPLLTDPQKHGIKSDLAFEVLAPSIPGFGWSEASKKRGLNQAATARIFHKLATRIGFKKYIAQGGDFGSITLQQLARLYPESLYGLHLNMLSLPYHDTRYLIRAFIGSYFPKLMFESPEFHNYSFKQIVFTYIQESGYFHLQATKPDTLGMALNDSPLGLLAYILEKFSTATNLQYRSLNDGGLEREFTKDELITSVMIYYLNGNMLQSQRFYKESFMDDTNRMLMREYVNVTTGYAALENDAIPPQPIEIVRLNFNVAHYTFIKHCGHFAAFEKPKLLAEDIFEFARKVVPQ